MPDARHHEMAKLCRELHAAMAGWQECHWAPGGGTLELERTHLRDVIRLATQVDALQADLERPQPPPFPSPRV